MTTKTRGRFAREVLPRAPRSYQWTPLDTVSTAIIAALAFLTRFIGLSSATAGGTPVFDEKHYVPQAWDIVRSQVNPLIGGIESNPGYGLVVHPPLAKQIEAIGEAVFGYTSMGWRVMAALFGVATVLMIMALARQVSFSPVVAIFAGFLALFDGVLLIGSRFGMLDIFQVFFIVAAAWAFARDRNQMDARITFEESEFGPRLGFRWWRFTMGVFLGLSLSVKWSGLYYMAFFGILSVLIDAHRRDTHGARRPLLGALYRDAFPAFASIVLLPVALYAWSWRAWFASETSVYRHAKADGQIPEDSLLQALPDSLANWLYYHQSVLKFHESLTSSGGHSHPWDSKPWAWLVAARPILYYSDTDIACGEDTCRRMIYLFGTPAIWWLTVPVLAWALWAMVVRKEGAYLIPFVSFLAGFLPWIAAYDRQMYFFYATALVPFTIVMIALALDTLRRIKPTIVTFYLALVVGMFAYFSPILYGYEIPDSVYNAIMWLPSWT